MVPRAGCVAASQMPSGGWKTVRVSYTKNIASISVESVTSDHLMGLKWLVSQGRWSITQEAFRTGLT